MKRLSTVFAFTTLAAATVVLAQQTTPQPQAQPPASTESQSQTPADPNTSTNTQGAKADKQTLMKECVTQVRAANPSVPEKDIKDYCVKEVDSYTSHHD